MYTTHLTPCAVSAILKANSFKFLKMAKEKSLQNITLAEMGKLLLIVKPMQKGLDVNIYCNNLFWATKVVSSYHDRCCGI